MKFDDRCRRIALLLSIMFLVSLSVRLLVLSHTFDDPGDAPHRATMSYCWSLHPYFVTSGYWLPGFLYLNGIIMSIFPEPMMVVRIANCLWGSLTVPMMFLLSRRMFGPLVACAAAALLAFLPMHVGLSVSSLTEPIAALLLISSMWLLLSGKEASEKSKSLRFPCLSLFLLFLATTIRCETWLLIPFWLIYLCFEGRSWRLVFLAAIALSILPVTWMAGCWAAYHQPLISFVGNTEPRIVPASLLQACTMLGDLIFSYFGPVILLAVIWGLLFELRRIRNKEFDARECRCHVFYLCLLGFFWVFQLLLCARYGNTMQERYTLIPQMLSLPFAGLAISYLPWLKKLTIADHSSCVSDWKKRWSAASLAVLILVDSLLLWFLLIRPPICVNTSRPDELIEVAGWLKKEAPASNILITSLNYRAFFLPLIDKKLFGRYAIVMDFWSPLHYIQGWLREHPPDFIVVGDDDGGDLDAIMTIADFKIEKKPEYKRNYVSVFRIIKGSFVIKPDAQNRKCFWYPPVGLRTLYRPVKEKTFSPFDLP